MGGCQEAIFKEEKQGEKAEIYLITQVLDWKPVEKGLMNHEFKYNLIKKSLLVQIKIGSLLSCLSYIEVTLVPLS